jgi:hypothetical protein
MARIDIPGGMSMYDDIEDLRGNERDKKLEKALGPEAVITLKVGRKWKVRRCPLCDCIKSFDPLVPNKLINDCDGECPCHDA